MNTMTKSRMEAFSDGVIAVIITVLVLELKVPHDESLEALTPLIPVFLSYVLSFIYVGIYWNNHHHMDDRAAGADEPADVAEILAALHLHRTLCRVHRFERPGVACDCDVDGGPHERFVEPRFGIALRHGLDVGFDAGERDRRVGESDPGSLGEHRQPHGVDDGRRVVTHAEVTLHRSFRMRFRQSIANDARRRRLAGADRVHVGRRPTRIDDNERAESVAPGNAVGEQPRTFEYGRRRGHQHAIDFTARAVDAFGLDDSLHVANAAAAEILVQQTRDCIDFLQ